MDSATLLQEYEQHPPTLVGFPFRVNSQEQGDWLAADVMMLIDVPYAHFRQQLQQPRSWCEFLLLNINIKSCVHQPGEHDELVVYVGRKQYQPPEITYQIHYRFELVASRDDFFEVKLTAAEGPMRTRDYLIQLQATSLRGKTLFKLGFAYTDSIYSRSAAYTYLKTLGRNKVGFSIVGTDSQGRPRYSEGMKAVVERNVMRYFLAVETYLTAADRSSRGFTTLLERWFDATELYHRQLYEYERDTYIKVKLQERLNQQRLQQLLDLKAQRQRDRAG